MGTISKIARHSNQDPSEPFLYDDWEKIRMYEGCPGLDPGIIQRDVSLAHYSTLGIGGNAHYLAAVTNQANLLTLLDWSRAEKIPSLIVGEGSNFLFSDSGFPGLVLQVLIPGIEQEGDEVVVGAGENLGSLIEYLNRRRLKGLERMYGIPGTLAGAVVGNAGAYGQETCEALSSATVLRSDGTIEVLPAERLHFRYRHSLFKEDRNLVLLRCRLRLNPGGERLQEASNSILEKRSRKYPSAIKCPGSFFKNVQIENLDPHLLKRIPAAFIMHDKIPAGKLLDAVGAKGARRRDAMVASYHGNLILNLGTATARDVLWLADKYAGRVLEHYGIELEPEIRIVDGDQKLTGQ